MSQITTASTETETGPRTVTLMNGSTFSFNSNVSTTAEKIPIIDAARIWSDKLEDRQAVAREVREASREIGFFYLVNHGIDPSHGETCLAEAKKFFALPEAKKMEVYTGLVPGEYVGYHPMECYNRNGWKRQDLSEAFNWNYEPSLDPEFPSSPGELPLSASIWPTDPAAASFRPAMYAYHGQLLRLARRLVRVFALALDLPELYFDHYVRRPEAGMRVLHYPAQEAAVDDQNGIGAHTDVECFTIVTQDDAGGLEVLSKAGNWIRADPVPGAFVVNIADCFMRQTNDFFVSTVHRVVNKSGRERYSAPFFFGFARDKLLEAIPTCVSEDNPMTYPVMTGGEYIKFRVSKQAANRQAYDKCAEEGTDAGGAVY